MSRRGEGACEQEVHPGHSVGTLRNCAPMQEGRAVVTVVWSLSLRLFPRPAPVALCPNAYKKLNNLGSPGSTEYSTETEPSQEQVLGNRMNAAAWPSLPWLHSLAAVVLVVNINRGGGCQAVSPRGRAADGPRAIGTFCSEGKNVLEA